ncbi:MAG: AMP-binding protein [Bacteroidia bacterium]|nr:AMP-binding protein [Bacteroidia bacterium]NNF31983.1 AMP-binding protein [Flavobacteriaceae bacterium]MBT8276179.1 AMP-binding protein [Bacteroidia bacterium]NNJ81910.1 AMP-binding protein [Flavobacteriaceae bacterium]NNK52954.1 AMP-binding protein [Flavobacteriaceae bacterium]
MKPTSQSLHPAFKLNGLDFSSAEEVLNFADGLLEDGNDQEASVVRFLEQWLDFNETVSVKTSGSTGDPKVIELRKEHMINSAKATAAYFKTGVNTRALLCLSADYIAGKMMLVRAMVLGWDLHIVTPSKDSLTEYDNDYDFVAMVPYQVWHSLESLGKVKKLIIGGGRIPAELETKLQEVSTEAFATYGMTETSTHVAVRRLNGPARSDSFSALPDVKFSVDERNCLLINAPNILDHPLTTNDVVTLNSPTNFNWHGRYDNVINSGGIKIYPEIVEAKLSSDISNNFLIASEKDEELGERVIMVYEGNERSAPNLSEAFRKLEPHERPKRVYSLSRFVYTETGKLKRQDVLKVLQKYK